MYIPFQVKVIHVPGMSHQSKQPKNKMKFDMKRFYKKIAPSGTIHSSRRIGVILIFYVNIYNVNVNIFSNFNMC